MNFENLTIKEVKELTDQFKSNNPNFKTSQEYLEDLK